MNEPQYIKIAEESGIELYVIKKLKKGKCFCKIGHFIDKNTGENLGQTCYDYIIYYDEQYNRLKEPKTNNVKWVED